MKKITVLFTVLLMLAASSAFAAIDAVFPSALNGTYVLNNKAASGVVTYSTEIPRTGRVFTGFTLNATRSAKTIFAENATFVPFNSSRTKLSSAHSLLCGAAGAGVQGHGNSTLSANFGFFNSTSFGASSIGQNNGTTGGSAGQNATFIRVNAVTINGAQSNVLDAMPGLVTIGQVNATASTTSDKSPLNPFLGIHTGSYDLVAAISNSTANLRAQGRTNTGNSGSSFMMSYTNGTIVDAVYDSAPWDYYAVGYDYDTHKSIYIVGQVYLDTVPASNVSDRTANARARFVVYGDDNAEIIDHSATDITYNATAIKSAEGTIEIFRDHADAYSLMQYGVMNKDRNMISGLTYNAVHGSSKQPVRFFAVMVKNGQYLSASDFANRGYKAIYSGFGGATKRSNNATQGIMSMTADANLNVDVFAAVNTPDGVKNTAALVYEEQQSKIIDGSLTLVASDAFKANVLSKMTVLGADGSTAVGFFNGKFAANKDYAVGIYQPAVNGNANGFALSVMIPDSAVVGPVDAATGTYQFNGTVATPAFARNSTDYSNDALRKAWPAIRADFVPLTGAIGFNSTLHPADVTKIKKSNFYQTFQVPFKGVAGRVNTLSLYKLMVNSNTAYELPYASSFTEGIATDGAWWISTLTGGGYQGPTADLVATSDYYLNYTLKDDGVYDYRKSDVKGQFGDPVVLGSITPSSSSSSSGCVFNPAASFGLEWLLLMLAPMVAIVRSRFKK